MKKVTVREIRDNYGDENIIFVDERRRVLESIDLDNISDEDLQQWANERSITVFARVVKFSQPEIKQKKFKSYEKCVHTEHCTDYRCKYGESDCPVVLGLKPASYPEQNEWF